MKVLVSLLCSLAAYPAASPPPLPPLQSRQSLGPKPVMSAKSTACSLLGLLLFLSAGCASFQSEWRKSVAAGPARAELLGCWQGTWSSDVNGHHDLLQCVVSRRDDGAFRARFHAKYHTVFTFNYAVPLTVERTNEASHFRGLANLGWLAGGVYKYEGTASATNFASTYTSKYDHGVFQMSRP
jgi:hypothetical protein